MVDNKFNIKVADFGLAKTITPELHMTHSFVGTLAYSCPQIVQNEGYNEKADIWSLGCIIFELMSLKTPFAGSNLLYIAKNIVSGDPLDFPQHYSQELQSFVNLCLTRDQAERPDVRQLLKAVAERVIIYTDELREK